MKDDFYKIGNHQNVAIPIRILTLNNRLSVVILHV